MKTILPALLIALMPVVTQAQTEVPEPPKPPEAKTGGDTTRIKIGNKEMVLVDDEDNPYINVTTRDTVKKKERTVSVFGTGRNRVFQGFEIGFGSFSYASDFDTDVPDGMDAWEVDLANSINWSINPFEVDIRLVKEYVKFSTGLGYTVKNFSLKNNYQLSKFNDTIIGAPSANDLQKNRLRTGYLTVPAMLFFNTSQDPENAFRIGGGVLAGMRLFQTYRTKYFEEGQKHKGIVNGGWETNFLTADLRGVVGYGPINLYATYSMVPLFDIDRGPELYPFTFGISFVNVF